MEYKRSGGTSFYTNLSQNFRAITFSDIHITSPSFETDLNIADEKGFSWDAGLRNQSNPRFRFDISAFILNYGNRIGELLIKRETDARLISTRTNIGKGNGLNFIRQDIVQ